MFIGAHPYNLNIHELLAVEKFFFIFFRCFFFSFYASISLAIDLPSPSSHCKCTSQPESIQKDLVRTNVLQNFLKSELKQLLFCYYSTRCVSFSLSLRTNQSQTIAFCYCSLTSSLSFEKKKIGLLFYKTVVHICERLENCLC